MIFRGVKNIHTREEKDYFIELISLYIRFVELYAERHALTPLCEDIDKTISEFINIGVINSIEEIQDLKDLLGVKYAPFVNAVKTVISNGPELAEIVSKLNNSCRHKLQEEAKRSNLPTIADFFCGAGGLSLGFIQNGFKIVLANDIEDVCIRTYEYNHPQVSTDKIIKGDIKQIVDNVKEYIDDDVDIVIGGPPCQGFSEANRQRVIDDPRNQLYKYYIQAVTNICPKFVVMENVKGMLKVADQVVEDYRAIRAHKDGMIYTYDVAYRLFNSVNFSVAQNRERLIYIAVRNDVAAEKRITPESLLSEIENSCKGNKVYTLNDALASIKPLEAPRIKGITEEDSNITGKKIDYFDYNQSEYMKLVNMGTPTPFVFNHKARYVSDVNYEIYKRLEQGQDSTVDSIKEIMPYAHRNHCFKDKYYKLIGDRPSRTITAHLKMDCHSHIHPNQIRSLTPREAARVQSFPDNYLFLGAYLKTYMQVGNAVPPMMARGIAKILKKYI